MSDHDQPVAANLLDRQFEAAAPNQRWVGDTTEFVIGSSGKLYLAVVLDLFSRFVVGWAVSAVNDRHLTINGGRGAARTTTTDHDALELVDGDRFRRPVVELRRLRRGVPGDLLRVRERPAVRQIRSDPRRPERVAAGRRWQTRSRRPPLDHGQDEAPRQRPARQPAPRRVDALEERRLRLVELGRLKVVIESLGRPMVGRDVVALAGLLVECFPTGTKAFKVRVWGNQSPPAIRRAIRLAVPAGSHWGATINR